MRLPLLTMLCLAILAIAPTAARAKGDPDHCAGNSDCAVVTPLGCCSGCGGHAPPFRAVRADFWSRQVQLSLRTCQQRNQRHQLSCPVFSCVKPPDCGFAPRARCVKGRCVIEVVLEGQCGTGDATARCGAQPAWAGGDACALYHLSRWVHCACVARGGKDCDAHRAQACWSDAKCRPATPAPRGSAPYSTCPVRR